VEILNPVVRENGVVEYGRSGLNVQSCFGVNGQDYRVRYERLVQHGLRPGYPDAFIQIRFVLHCYAALSLGADVDDLIREFNAAQRGDGTEAAHALSLAEVFYHYTSAGVDIVVNRTRKSESTPDAVINGVTCDLKVRVDQTNRRAQKHSQLLLSGKCKCDEYSELYESEVRSSEEDLAHALHNAVPHGFKQAKCVILDLSSHFHTWDYYRLKSLQQAGGIVGLSARPIPAVANSCILLSRDDSLRAGGGSFNPRAYWGYLPTEVEVDLE